MKDFFFYYYYYGKVGRNYPLTVLVLVLETKVKPFFF